MFSMANKPDLAILSWTPIFGADTAYEPTGGSSDCLPSPPKTRLVVTRPVSARPHTNALPARFATDFCTKYISVSATSEVATTM
jgi:hypothetical protein